MEKKVIDIINVIRANNGAPKVETVSSKDRLREDLGFTSFDLAELTVRIEDEFDVDIFEEGLIYTVGEILDKLETQA